jgi:hypothetical protein
LIDRKEKLNNFLQILISRQDLLSTQELRNFVLFEEHIPKSKKNSPGLFFENFLNFSPVFIRSSVVSFVVLTNIQKLEKIKSLILENENSIILCIENDGKEL